MVVFLAFVANFSSLLWLFWERVRRFPEKSSVSASLNVDVTFDDCELVSWWSSDMLYVEFQEFTYWQFFVITTLSGGMGACVHTKLPRRSTMPYQEDTTGGGGDPADRGLIPWLSKSGKFHFQFENLLRGCSHNKLNCPPFYFFSSQHAPEEKWLHTTIMNSLFYKNISRENGVCQMFEHKTSSEAKT